MPSRRIKNEGSPPLPPSFRWQHLHPPLLFPHHLSPPTAPGVLHSHPPPPPPPPPPPHSDTTTMSTSTSLNLPSSSSSTNPQAWFCTTGLPSDVVIEAGTTTFHLHKFPLVSKSRKLQRLLMDQEEQQNTNQVTQQPEIAEVAYHLSLPDIPGGANTFEAAAKFCYGVRLELSPSTVVPLRCAAEYLEMTEDLTHDNLCARCDRYLSHHVLRSLRYSIRALRSANSVASSAESLGLTDRLVDFIASRASTSDPSLFGWPVVPSNDSSRTTRSVSSPSGWPEELGTLSLPSYKRVLAAMESKGASPEVVEGSLFAYARRAIPGLSRYSRRTGTAGLTQPPPTEAEQAELVEAVIAHLPLRRTPATLNTSARFLFGLLKIANILRVSQDSRETLERRIAMQLDQATLDDLLMPSYSYGVETLYDVECVERLVAHFLEGVLGSRDLVLEESAENSQEALMAKIGRLVDGYLSEVASDANLSVEKFCALAFALPENARVYDDGLYRAVDVYLKEHPRLSETERERICGVMDCQKFTLEACTHAAQNERLPLRAIVQVLFFEQLQLRHAVAGTLQLHGTHADSGHARVSQPQGGEDQMLRLDMDSMRSRVNELERECSSIKRAMERIDRTAKSSDRGDVGSAGRTSLRRRFGCKFPTQVCDSHERNIVGGRRRMGEQRA